MSYNPNQNSNMLDILANILRNNEAMIKALTALKVENKEETLFKDSKLFSHWMRKKTNQNSNVPDVVVDASSNDEATVKALIALKREYKEQSFFNQYKTYTMRTGGEAVNVRFKQHLKYFSQTEKNKSYISILDGNVISSGESGDVYKELCVWKVNGKDFMNKDNVYRLKTRKKTLAAKKLKAKLPFLEYKTNQLKNEYEVTKNFPHMGVKYSFLEDMFYMRYLPGGTFNDFLHALRKDPRLMDIEGRFKLTLKLLDMMQKQAHSKGFFHRDIKPDNIILSEEKEPSLIDYGFAQSSTKEQIDGNGTPIYSAPEYLAGTKASITTDLFPMVLIIAELWGDTKKDDFQCYADLYAYHRNVTFKDLFKGIDGLSDAIKSDIEKTLTQATRYEPGQRFSFQQLQAKFKAHYRCYLEEKDVSISNRDELTFFSKSTGMQVDKKHTDDAMANWYLNNC